MVTAHLGFILFLVLYLEAYMFMWLEKEQIEKCFKTCTI